MSRIQINKDGENYIFYCDSSYVKAVKSGDFYDFIFGASDTDILDSGLPLIQGENFGFKPQKVSYVTENSITFVGKTERYPFSVTLSATPESQLIKISLSLSLSERLYTKPFEPSLMLWSKKPIQNITAVYMESPNYQTSYDSVYWNSAFPCAYLSNGEFEAGIFLNAEPMDWFSLNNIDRFHSMQVRVQKDINRTGMGLAIRRPLREGVFIEKGSVLFEFFYFADKSNTKYTKLSLLKTAMERFSECFPSSAKPLLKNYVDGGRADYTYYSHKIAEHLLQENNTFQYGKFFKSFDSETKEFTYAQWNDEPLNLSDSFSDIILRPSFAYDYDKRNEKFGGDWNCRNNALIPLIVFDRINPDPERTEFIKIARNALKTFYDPVSHLVRSDICFTPYRGNGPEFTFQNFFMGMGTHKANQLSPLNEFDPSLSGKFILGLSSLIDMAHKNSYVFPQLFHAGTKENFGSIDEVHLGKTIDVWTTAIYACAMIMGYEFTEDDIYFNEAKKAVDVMFEGLTFEIDYVNYKASFAEPYDFPVNESNTTAWGVIASQWLYNKTGDEKYLTYSDHYKYLTLRLMNWFESRLADDNTDIFLQSAGLFKAFSTADSPTPWETIYAYMPLLDELLNSENPSELLLNMFNVYKTNGLFFCGASWDPEKVKNADRYHKSRAPFLPAEDFYQIERPVLPGQNGPCVYMSNSTLYQYLIYEAYCTLSDPNLMALCLDFNGSPSEMAEGIERNFLIYNPTEDTKEFTAIFHNLSYDKYILRYENTEKIFSKENLKEGIKFILKPKACIKMKLSVESKEVSENYRNAIKAQKALVKLYVDLQKNAEENKEKDFSCECEIYKSALCEYKKANYEKCILIIADIQK